MGNGVSFALFSRTQRVLELYVIVTCNNSTDLRNVSMCLRSVLVNKNGELLECMAEYYQALGENLNDETITKWVDSQIQCSLSNTEKINFSEFQAFYLTYASADEVQIVETAMSTPAILEATSKLHLNQLLLAKEIKSEKQVGQLTL